MTARKSSKPGPKGKAKEIRAALLQGEKPTEIARRLGVTLPAVSVQKRNLIKDGKLPDPKATLPSSAPTSSESDQASDLDQEFDRIAASSDREWLEWFRNNEQVPVGERLRAAIALARVREEAQEVSWTPPEDDELWAEQLYELLMAQSEEVRAIVLGKLAGAAVDTTGEPVDEASLGHA